MTIALRVILVTASILNCIYISRKLKKSQMQIIDTVFWILLSMLFIVLSIFPQLASALAGILGFQAPVNFIFLLIIFLLLLKCFMLSMRVSQLDNRIRSLTEEIAIRENEKESAFAEANKGYENE